MDQELSLIIKDCLADKGKAQKQLYQRYQRMMYGVCLRYAKDYSEAEDIAQDGFIKIFRNLNQYSGKGSFEGWMKKIMINTALERYRKTDKLYLVSEYTDYEEKYKYEDVLAEVTGKELLQFIHELSPQYRTIFNLYAIEGYTHVEISKMLGISEGTSKSNLSRARAILQEKVNTEYFAYKKQKQSC